jgi:hypothetical protein
MLISHNPFEDGQRSYSLPVVGIILGKGWLDKGSWEPHQLFAHEFAHQWDISTGFSASQELRITHNNKTAPWDVYTNNGGYGNQGSREYLAEAFSWSIYDHSGLQMPSGNSLWIADRITYETSFRP